MTERHNLCHSIVRQPDQMWLHLTKPDQDACLHQWLLVPKCSQSGLTVSAILSPQFTGAFVVAVNVLPDPEGSFIIAGDCNQTSQNCYFPPGEEMLTQHYISHEEYTSWMTSYISKCVDVVFTKIKSFPNHKTLKNGEVHPILKRRHRNHWTSKG